MFEALRERISRDITHLSNKAKRTLSVNAPSADALWLSQAALIAREQNKVLVLIADNASQCLRLRDDMQYFAPELNVVYFPDWETLPYDLVSPHQDLVSERLEILYKLSERKEKANTLDAILLTTTTAAQTIAPPQYMAGRVFFFKKGEEINAATLRERLVSAGYQHVSQVVAPGEFSVRGSLIDIFPMGAAHPFRLDLFDTEIDSIRTFDPDTQRSLELVDEVRILPGREFRLQKTTGRQIGCREDRHSRPHEKRTHPCRFR